MEVDKYVEWTESVSVYPAFTDYPYFGLVEEAGEVAGAKAKYLRGDFNEIELDRRLKKELGDVLFMAARICHDKGWKMSQILDLNVEKLTERNKNNTIKGDGDDR